MEKKPPSLPDEVYGARAAGALLAGDVDGAEQALRPVSVRYLLGFLCRLAVLAPSVAERLGWRLGRDRLRSRARGGIGGAGEE